MWKPRVDRKAGPIYLSVARAIAADVQAGKLRAGDRLPAQRDLADAIGVTVTTVTRAYAEAQRLGLIDGGPRSEPAIQWSALPLLVIRRNPCLLSYTRWYA